MRFKKGQAVEFKAGNGKLVVGTIGGIYDGTKRSYRFGGLKSADRDNDKVSFYLEVNGKEYDRGRAGGFYGFELTPVRCVGKRCRAVPAVQRVTTHSSGATTTFYMCAQHYREAVNA